MNKEISLKIIEKIESYNKIIIGRHFRPDGDAIGSTKALYTILKLTYPDKDIRLINSDYSEYLSFLGPENEPVEEPFYKDALGIILDTGTIDRVSNKNITNCKEIIKIDHHIDTNPYGDISWVEPNKSSTCELIADFYLMNKDRLEFNKEAAYYIYCGMVTDSGRFRFNDVTGDTLKTAGEILSYGVDTESLFSNLYMEDFNILKARSQITNRIQITQDGTAYLYLDLATQKEFGLSQEEASNCVSLMDSIKGSLIWICFIKNQDNPDIRVRLRSRFVPIVEIAEKYRGGGHAFAAGSTLKTEEEIPLLLADADQVLKEYKNTHEGWL